jgi:DNA-binding CsgD family transcriptional regulator
MKWTDEELAILHRMLSEGYGYAPIADALKRNPNTVAAMARRLGLRVDKSRSADRPVRRRGMSALIKSLGVGPDDFAAMLAEGLANQEIAARIGVTMGGVRRALLALDMRRTAEQKRMIRRRVVDGETCHAPGNPRGRPRGAEWAKNDAMANRAIARGSAELRDRILALYRREAEVARHAAA